MCEICQHWARDASDQLAEHHPTCPNRPIGEWRNYATQYTPISREVLVEKIRRAMAGTVLTPPEGEPGPDYIVGGE